LLVETHGAVAASYALFLGTESVYQLEYAAVREFAQRALATLAELAPETRHIAMTIHGRRTMLRLDETELLRSQIAGYFDALQAGTYPENLERISIVELNDEATTRLRASAEQIFADGDRAAPFQAGWGYHLLLPRADQPVTVIDSDVRPHAYVIMPDNAALEDVFYFGIQQPTHAHGLLCEQVAATSFDDAEILETVKQRISQASVVIAEMTRADETLYLQLGYAWGQHRPTILIAQEGAKVNLPQSICIRYNSIKHLEKLLGGLLDELNTL
jgi:hypothetical protein